jgi:hypothetical protein
MAAKLMPVMAALQDWLRVGKKFSTVPISLLRWVAKFVARLLATAALKNSKWATQAKEWPIHSNPPIFHRVKSRNGSVSMCSVVQSEPEPGGVGARARAVIKLPPGAGAVIKL